MSSVKMRLSGKLVVLLAVVALIAGLCAMAAPKQAFAGGGGITGSATTVAKKTVKAKGTNPVTFGSTGGKALSQLKMKQEGGNVAYTLWNAGKKSTASNGKMAGKKGKTLNAVSIKLNGDMAKNHNVYYRVYVKGYGWMGWAKNGAKAGTNDKTKAVTAVQVQISTKVEGVEFEAPNTDRAAYSSKGGFINTITGDKKTDAKIKAFAKKNGMDLKKCYNALTKSWKYKNTKRAIVKTATLSKSRVKTEVKAWFSKKSGDCYTSAAVMASVAKYLGYQSSAVTGKVATSKADDGTLRYQQPYAWTDVVMGGKHTIIDVNMSSQLIREGKGGTVNLYNRPYSPSYVKN